jgi:hypothetical protein
MVDIEPEAFWVQGSYANHYSTPTPIAFLCNCTQTAIEDLGR